MRVPHEELLLADLRVGWIYEDDGTGKIGGEPIHFLLGCQNQGGFRARGGWKVPKARAVALYTTGNQIEWPDHLQSHDRTFLYFGDNRHIDRSVGESLESKAKGNGLLGSAFAALHGGMRELIPPFLVFEQETPGRYNVRFIGLAVPGADHLGEGQDLTAAWTRVGAQGRFINYRAVFTILDVDVVPRAWLDRVTGSDDRLVDCPEPWRRFVETGQRSAP